MQTLLPRGTITFFLFLLVGLMLHVPGSLAAHPVGAVSETSAKNIGNNRLKVIECLDCHVTHGAADTGLLIGRDHAAKACLSCHKGLREETHAGGHPLSQVVPRRAMEALTALGGTFGPNHTLTCGSCHTAHGDEADMGARCLACHEEQATVASLSPAAKGHRSAACTDCHNKDSATLKVKAGGVEGDPTHCLRCHGEGSKNQPVDTHPGQVGHPLVDKAGGFGPSDPPLNGCSSCHGGHDIVKPDVSLCERCHLEQADDHARGGHGSARCLDCHPPHQERAMHADIAGATPLNPVSRRCLACHAEDAAVEPSVARVESYEHPEPVFQPDGARWAPLGALPLFDAAGRKVADTENGALTCASCHLSHGPDRTKAGDHLRRPGWEGVCSACHADDGLIYYRWYHYRERLDD